KNGRDEGGSGPGDGADRAATERKRPRPAVSWSRSKAFARTRSHRLKICVPRGLGGYPQQAREAIWIATSIACQSLRKSKSVMLSTKLQPCFVRAKEL